MLNVKCAAVLAKRWQSAAASFRRQRRRVKRVTVFNKLYFITKLFHPPPLPSQWGPRTACKKPYNSTTLSCIFCVSHYCQRYPPLSDDRTKISVLFGCLGAFWRPPAMQMRILAAAGNLCDHSLLCGFEAGSA